MDKHSSNKRALEEFYLGMGVTCDHLKSRVSMDDNMSLLSYYHSKDGYPEEVDYSGYDDDSEWGDDQDYSEYDDEEEYLLDPPDSHGLSVLSKNKSGFGGNISIGYGEFLSGNSWFTDNCYMGIELTVDVAGDRVFNSGMIVSNPNEPQIKNEYGKCSVRYKGIVPTVAFRFGGYVQEIESMVFFKAGGKYLRYEMDFEFFPDQKMKGSAISPILGMGVEKNVGHGFSLKAEADYCFKSSKTHGAVKGNFRDGPDKDYKAQIKHGVRGYTARLVGVYHF